MFGFMMVLVALGASPAERLAEAQVAFDELQYERVLTLVPVDSEWDQFSRAEVVQTLSLRALSLASLKRDEEASRFFRQLLAVEPGFVLPEQFGPRVRTLLLEAKDAASRAGPLGLSVQPGALALGGTTLGLIVAVQLSWRHGGVVESVTVAPSPRIEMPWPSEGTVEAWGVVLGPGRSVLATWGSAERPFVFGSQAVEHRGSAPPPGPGAGTVAGLALGGAGVIMMGIGAALLVDSNRPALVLAAATRDTDGRVTSLTQREAFALDAEALRSFRAGGALLITGSLALAVGASLVLFDRLRVSAGPSSAALTVSFDATFAVARRAP